MHILLSVIAIFILCLTAFSKTSTVQATNAKPQFAFPLDCTLGKDCWTINYLDVDPAPDSHKDFKCASKTYEDHKGIDFALRSAIEMQRGVNVLAAAKGKVLRLRDGESDTLKTDDEYKAIRKANKDCGNGVIIDHGNGLLSYYCHLKKGSIRVKPKQPVEEGQPIAQVGRSGYAEFPHLHFTVIWEGGHIDPFTGLTKEQGCGGFKRSLWKEDIPYEPYAVFDGGFEDKVPDFTAIKKGRIHPKTLSQEVQNLVYWVGFYHAKTGDKIDMEIKNPNGKIIARRQITLEKSRKRPSFYYTGRKLRGKPLQPGTYTGTAIFKREGFAPQTYTHSIKIK